MVSHVYGKAEMVGKRVGQKRHGQELGIWKSKPRENGAGSVQVALTNNMDVVCVKC